MNRDLEALYDKMLVDGFNYVEEKCKNEVGYIFERDEDGNTMLHYAACDGNLDAIKQLIILGACPFIYNRIAMTPLSNAAGCGNVSCLKSLLEISHYGLLDHDRAELMAIAASKGKYENLELMLNEGFDCNLYHREDPILYWAMQSESLDIVKLLCEHGAEVNAVNDVGNAPLYDASANGLIGILEYLISYGACIDKPMNNGSTPLIIACCYNQVGVARILLSHGCDMEAKTKDGITALLYAIGYGNVELVQLLLNKGADKNITDKRNKGISSYCNRIKNRHVKDSMKELLQI